MDGGRRRYDAVRRAGQLVGASQVGFGVALMMAPDSVGRPFGLKIEKPWVRWFARLYGVRDLATGLGLWYAARNPRAARPWLAMEALIQAFDAIASAAALRSGAITKPIAIPVMVVAPVWVALCIAGMIEAPAEPEPTSIGDER